MRRVMVEVETMIRGTLKMLLEGAWILQLEPLALKMRLCHVSYRGCSLLLHRSSTFWSWLWML